MIENKIASRPSVSKLRYQRRQFGTANPGKMDHEVTFCPLIGKAMGASRIRVKVSVAEFDARRLTKGEMMLIRGQ